MFRVLATWKPLATGKYREGDVATVGFILPTDGSLEAPLVCLTGLTGRTEGGVLCLLQRGEAAWSGGLDLDLN